MGSKRHKPEANASRLRQVEVLSGPGMRCVDVFRQMQISAQAFYGRLRQRGGMGPGQLKELTRIQKKNDRLRRAVTYLTSDRLIL